MDNFNLIIIIVVLAFLILLSVDIFWIYKVWKLRKLKNEVILNKQSRLIKFGINFIVILAIILALALGYINISPRIIASTPQSEGIWESYSKPLEVYFNMPVDAARMYVNMNPEIKGEWKFVPFLGISRFTTYGYFIPEETIFPGQRIVVYITGIGRVGFRTESHEYGFVFDSVKLPEISSSTPANDDKEVSDESSIILNLNKPSEANVAWSFKISPQINLKEEYPNSTQIILTPEKNFDLSTAYTLQVFKQAKIVNLSSSEVIETDNPILTHELIFTTKATPLVRSYLPHGNSVKTDTPIKIKFMTEMNRESVQNNFITIPEIKGTFSWLDDKTLNFKPDQSLTKDTSYTVTIKKGIFNSSGLESTSDITFDFKTIGYINISETSPANNQVKVDETAVIRVTFNQEVDHDSAQNKFGIEPATSGQFSWEDNTFIYTPNAPLNFNTVYSVKFSSGIKSIYGLDSKEDLNFNFTTRTNEVIISIPQYYQPQVPVSFSCNIYAAKMVLAWKGYQLDATNMISEIGYNSNQVDGHWTGNPYKEYVGSNDGFWGYGAYAEAIQELFNNRGISTQVKRNMSLKEVASLVAQGHSVIIWRRNDTQGGTSDISWTASDGTYVKAITSQHGSVITGFRGSVDNPTAIYLNDPWYGPHWKSISDLDYKWSLLDRTGLIVY